MERPPKPPSGTTKTQVLEEQVQKDPQVSEYREKQKAKFDGPGKQLGSGQPGGNMPEPSSSRPNEQGASDGRDQTSQASAGVIKQKTSGFTTDYDLDDSSADQGNTINDTRRPIDQEGCKHGGKVKGRNKSSFFQGNRINGKIASPDPTEAASDQVEREPSDEMDTTE